MAKQQWRSELFTGIFWFSLKNKIKFNSCSDLKETHTRNYRYNVSERYEYRRGGIVFWDGISLDCYTHLQTLISQKAHEARNLLLKFKRAAPPPQKKGLWNGICQYYYYYHHNFLCCILVGRGVQKGKACLMQEKIHTSPKKSNLEIWMRSIGCKPIVWLVCWFETTRVLNL